MPIDVVLCTKTKDFNDFIQVPFQLHQHDANWVPPLQLTIKRILNKKNPFFKNAEINHWVAYRNNKPIGRISCIINHLHNRVYDEKIAFWGFFESENSSEVSNALFKRTEEWALEQGIDALRGPMNPSINYECGLQTSAFETKPYIMMPQNPEYYVHLVEHVGYKKLKDLQAWTVSVDNVKFDSKKSAIIKKLCDKHHISIRQVNIKDFKNELRLIVQIYNDAWANNWGYLPLDEDEFYYLAKELKSTLLPNFNFIAEIEGKPCGFSVGLPDLNQVLIHNRNGKLLPFNFLKLLWQLKVKKAINQARIPLLGVLQKYQHLPIGGLLYYEYFQKINQHNYQKGEFSWILEDNHAMQAGLELINATHYKTYRIYEKNIDE